MSRLTALPYGSAELVPVVVAIIVTNPGIWRAPAQILLVLVLYQEQAVEQVLVGAGSVDFSHVVGLPVALVLQHATSALGQTISHATVRLRQ